MEDVKHLFAKRLKELCGNKNLYQISKESGIENSMLYKYINGKTTPSLQMLWILSKYFGVSIDYLVGKED